MNPASFAAIVLAAGEGSRMQSSVPKILHEVAGRTMIDHVLAALAPLAPAATVIVLGRGMDKLAKALAPATTVIQDPPRGTGDAVRVARPAVEPHLRGLSDVVVLFADMPLLQPATIELLIKARRKAGAAIAVAGMRPSDPSPFGRVVLGSTGGVERIVEARDASAEERKIGLCNGSLMAIKAEHLFDLVDRLGTNNAKREYYLTDVVGIARRRELTVTVAELPAEEVAGINTRADLAAAEAIMQDRLRRRAMAGGATLIAPETVFFSTDTRLGRDVVIEPNVIFGTGVTIADTVRIRSFSHLEGATIATGAIVGPFARLRPGTVLEHDVHVGNFVEVKATRLGAGVKAGHLSYLGDSDIGAETNIGAGTITCNYDGFNKFRTTIGERVFIGSNTALVAPVSVGDGAYVATGSVVTSDVPADALAIARGRQVNKPGRAAELRARLRRKNK